LAAGDRREARPVFLFCGKRAITKQAATRYLARHHERLARKHGQNSFVLLLKVVNSQAYGPDVVELVGDVTRAAQAALPVPAERGRSPTSWRPGTQRAITDGRPARTARTPSSCC